MANPFPLTSDTGSGVCQYGGASPLDHWKRQMPCPEAHRATANLARKLAQRDHNIVIGEPADGLVEELEALGAEVEVVT